MSAVIDVHTHVAVASAEALVAGTPGMAEELAVEQPDHSAASLQINPEQLDRLLPTIAVHDVRLAAMDRMGVDVQVVGPMPMHHSWADRPLAEEYTAAVNDGIAAFCAAMPDRFLAIGTAPLQHPDLAASVAEKLPELGIVGVSVSTTVAGRELAEAFHDPFWAAAEAAGLFVLIHPWGCSLGSRLASSYLGNTVGQPVETAVALSHIIFSGLLDRFPRLRLCACHGGGYLPTYLGRSDHAWTVRPDARTCAELPSSYLRRIWFDSLVYTGDGLSQLVAAVGTDRVVLGTDYPWDMGVDDPLQRLEAANGLSGTDKQAIRSENARALLGLESPTARGATS